MHKFTTLTVMLVVTMFALSGCMVGTVGQEAAHQHEEDHSHDAMDHEHGHEHGAVEVPEAMAVPKVSIEILPDPKSGWNLHIMTQDFLFAPERASMEHSPGEGHAHLYVDGEKIGRLYGPWYHISELSPGQHEIRVTLNANDHRDYTVNGEVISASTTITVE